MNYIDWAPNRHAALAMALHNFRFKDCSLKLSSTNRSTLIAYLLMVCDEIQEWERDRMDVDAELTASHKNIKKTTELVGIIFRDKYAYVILNHILRDLSLKEDFEEYLDEKIILQRKHYPIKVIFPQIEKDFRNKILRNSILATSMAGSLSGLLPGPLPFFPAGLIAIEINPDTIDKIRGSTKRLTRLRKIAETQNIKNLLTPSEPNVYKIFVDHRIEGERHLTVMFPF